MSKQPSTLFEWQFVAESDPNAPWPPTPAHPSSPTAPNGPVRLRRVLWLGVALAVLLVAGIGVVYAHHEAVQGVQAIEREIQAAAEAEEWVAHQVPQPSTAVAPYDVAAPRGSTAQPAPSLRTTPARADGPVPVLHIQSTRFAYDKVAATLLLTQTEAAGAASGVYRQTRFYRATADGWLRTEPDPALWGSPRTLETAHLIWRYRGQDEAVVAAVADPMEALYVQMQRDYGLAQSAGEAKQVIEVQVDTLPKSSALFSPAGTTILVASPAVYLVPVGRTDAEILAQAAALALLTRMWAQAMAQHGIELSFTLFKTMALWELWDTDLSLSGWNEEILQWVFRGGALAGEAATVTLPAHYDELCAAYATWGIKPFHVGVPLACDETDRDFEHILLAGLSAENLRFFQEIYLHYGIRSTFGWGNAVMLYTVIDYAVTTYGRDRLPALVAALGQHDTWATLIPAVYGVSLDEFDTGWRIYLFEHYGVAKP